MFGCPVLSRFWKGPVYHRSSSLDITDFTSHQQYPSTVRVHLKRYYGTRALHFITFSCYRRQPFLSLPSVRDTVLQVLEETRRKYDFVIVGYVIMPEHVHLLMNEPEIGDPSVAMAGAPSSRREAP